MIAIALRVLLVVLTLEGDWMSHVEIERYDGERTFTACAWRYQNPPIYCLEVPL